jgi:prevent-host-death family protein
MKSGRPPEPVWSVADAKAQLSRLISQARDAPQIIQSRGAEVARVIAPEAYARLQADAQAGSKRAKWLAFLSESKALSDEGGFDLDLPPRERRASPFGRRRP